MNLRLPNWMRASAPTHPSTLSLTGPAVIEAAAAAADGRPAGLPRFNITAYTGEVMKLEGWPHPVIIELTGIQLAPKVKALRDHDPKKIVGHSERAEVTADGVFVQGVISGTGGDAAEVASTGKNGFPWEASVGANPSRVEFLAAGKTAVVNNRNVTGPAYIARAALLREVSFVAMGADPNTSASVAASASTEKDTMQFNDWLKAKGFEPNTISETQKLTLKAAFDAEQLAAAKPPVVDPAVSTTVAPVTTATPATLSAQALTDMRAQYAAEADRVGKINATCAGHGEIAAKAIREGWTTEKAELEVLRASRPQAPGAIVGRTGTDQDRVNALSIEAAMSLSVGVPEKVIADRLPQANREQVMNAAVSSQFRGAGIHMLMDVTIAAAGRHYNGDRKSEGFIHAAFEADNMLRASGFSSFSLSGILGSVANKALLDSFAAMATVVPDIAREVDSSDLKAFKSYRLTGGGEFEDVGADGELKHLTLTEEEFSNQVKTKGSVVTLTRTHIINDDLGAFVQVPKVIGRKAIIAREKMVFKLLLSNPSNFFHADNNNYIEGAATALSITALSSALQKFLEQKDSANEPILMPAGKLLVPPALKVIADQLFNDTNVNETTTADKGKPNSNPHKGMYKPVVAPYLASAFSLAGASNTAFYLLANPADSAMVEVAYLRGKRQPTIESGMPSFETLGISYRGFWDVGVAMQEKRAAVKSKGAA